MNFTLGVRNMFGDFKINSINVLKYFFVLPFFTKKKKKKNTENPQLLIEIIVPNFEKPIHKRYENLSNS